MPRGGPKTPKSNQTFILAGKGLTRRCLAQPDDGQNHMRSLLYRLRRLGELLSRGHPDLLQILRIGLKKKP